MQTLKGISFCFLTFFAGVFGITFNNGRYEGINIVIQNSVDENENLLERIKDVFTAGSQFLFEASKYHVYFGQINIIIPKNWTSKSWYTSIPARSALDTYITVEEGKMKTPHVKPKKFRCGVQAWYMYLTPSFLLTEGTTKWGNHANVIVHEWGHYRWGLFDEYGKKRRGRFYLQDEKWQPVRCSESISGNIGRGSNCRQTSECDASNSTKMMNETCKFCPDLVQTNTDLGSIMSYQYIDAVSFFCDSADDKSVPVHQRHNKFAPSLQNKKCDHKSAWEVMREHDDFKSGARPADTNTTPEFQIKQETDGYRVFVLDVSGSMRSYSRIDILRQAGEYIIQEKIPENSFLGIVTFNSTATTKMYITQVTAQSVRNGLIAALPTVASGGTCIGCGINKALTMLSSILTDRSGSEIIVISDGIDGSKSVLDASINSAIDADVTIHSISVSQAADTTLREMAVATGGNYLSYLDQGSISLAAAFTEIVSGGATTFASEPTTLLSEKSNTAISSFSFDIDSSIGKHTAVTVLQTTGTASMSLEVTSPDGTVQRQSISNANSLTVTIPDIAVPGKYNVTANTSTSFFEYYVSSTPIDSEVLRVQTYTPSQIDFSLGELPVIQAYVMKGRAAVLNANVIAVVESGTGTTSCNVTLLDNGAEPDDTADDGTYNGAVPRQCLSSGRISIKVYTRGENGSASVNYGIGGADSPDSDEDSNSTEILTDSFQRFSVTDEIYVSNFVSTDEDITAPGRITNVDIIDISTRTTQHGESRNFTITWTATGDDLNIGQAFSYELRISSDVNVLVNNFTHADLLDVVNANFTPKAAGEEENIRIEIDAEESYSSTTFLGVRAKDEAGNAGAVSNIVSILVANGYRIKVEGDVVYSKSFAEEAIEEDVIQEEKKKNLTTIAIGLSSAAAVIVIAVIAVSVCMKKLKAKESVEDCEFGSRASTTTVVSIDKPLRDFYTNMASRQTVAKKTFQSAQLQTIPEREESWITSFSSRPLSPYQRKSFDIISQGSCSIEMLNDPNDAFAEHMEDYLNTDATSISCEQLSPRSDSLPSDDGIMIENSPGAEVDILPEKATTAQSDDTETKCKFLTVLEDMAEEFSIQTTGEGLSKEENAQEIVPGTVVILEENHAKKENRKGFKRVLKEPYFEERSVTCTSLSVEFPALHNDEISQEISKLYDDVNC